MPGEERERERERRGREKERDPGLDCTVHVQDERQEKKQTIGLPADKPDGPGRDAARALASSVWTADWTADWNSAREKVTDVAVDEGTEVDAEEPVGDVDPEDDMMIDLGRATIHLDNENRKNEESSLTQH